MISGNRGDRETTSRRFSNRVGWMLLFVMCLVPLHILRARTGAAQNISTRSETTGKESEQFATGPEIGRKIPFFRAPDQHGKMQDFDSIRGPKGAMIVFFRSADW